MSKSEDYLDQLLNGMSGEEHFDDNDDLLQEEPQKENIDIFENSNKSERTEDDFLNQFEQELMDKDDSDDFLRQFEQELSSGEVKTEPETTEEKPFFDNIDQIMDSVKDQMQDDGGNASESNENNMISGLDGLEEAEESDDFDLDPLGLGNFSESESMDFGEEADADGNTDSDEAIDLGTDSGLVSDDKDLMDLLNQDSDFSDIGDMLQADDENMGIDDGDPFGSFAEAEQGETLDQSASSTEDTLSLEDVNTGTDGKGKKKKDKKSKEKAAKKEKAGEKTGFFAKLGKILFGDEEDQEASDTISIEPTVTSIEELSDENLELLKELGETKAAPVEKKEDKKEKKKKEKKEKKPKKEKAPKPKKEKKPKPPKEPDNTPPLPKVPVILIFVMVISLLVLILTGTKLVGYSNSISNAENFFAEGNYTEAFNAVSGLTVKDKDADSYEKYRIVALVASEYTAYESMMDAKVYDMALDSLIRTIGRYDKYLEDADAYGCKNELDKIESEAEAALNDNFGVTVDKAREVYALEEREEYSLQIYQILKNAGLEKVTE